MLAISASADAVLCGAGAGAGQCNAPNGVAVDREDGILYGADNGNHRVLAFDADSGAFLRGFGWNVASDGAPGDTPSDQFEICTTSCQAGSVGSGAGQFGSVDGIAVDNDPASPGHHDVYVLDNANNRVQKFRPVGASVEVKTCSAGPFSFATSSPKLDVGPGGILHVAEKIGSGERRVQKFSHECLPVAVCEPLAPGDFGNGLQGFAVDSAGNFYLASAGGRPIRKYDSSCALVNTPPFDDFHTSFNIRTLAIDEDDNIFVGDSTVTTTDIYAYTSAGTMFRVLYGNGTLLNSASSLAPYTSTPPTGDVFATEPAVFSGPTGRLLHIAFEDPGPVVHPDPGQTSANPIGNTWATLNSRVNPEDKASEYRFEYVDDASYDSEGGFASPNTKVTSSATVVPPATPAFAPSLFRLASVSAQIGCLDPKNPPQPSCLAPNTLYHFRAVATNADGEDTGPEQTFETKLPFEIKALWSSAVGVDAAKLSAEVNPLNIPASGHLEYVEEARCLKDVEELGPGHCFDQALSTAKLDFGSGEAPVVRSVQLHSLKADTAYRYRIVVENVLGSTDEEEGAFTTFAAPTGKPDPCANKALRFGPSAGLPDCRAYEMVSPVDKEGGEIAVQLTAPDAFAEIPQSASAVPNQGRGLAYSSYRPFGDVPSAPYTSQYLASRGAGGWTSEGISPPREGASFSSLGGLDNQYRAFSSDLGWGLLWTDSEPPLTSDAIPGFSNLYRRDSASGAFEAICPTEPPSLESSAYISELQGRSANGELVVFRANDKLTADASDAKGKTEEPIGQTYACAGGELRVASVLPPALGGKATAGHSSVGIHSNGRGDFTDSRHNAVSADGSRIYWTDSGEFDTGPGRLYLRENPLGEGAECSGPAAPCTVAVSEAVSPNPARFWTASPDGSVAIFSVGTVLYRFDAIAKTATPIAEGFTGLAGFSEDAERLYLVSTKELAPGGEAGEENLYLREQGVGFELVAVLEEGPNILPSYCEIHSPVPLRRCSRATADGTRLAFMSQESLTGYDNEDAASGEEDAEVFLYDTTANEGAGKLLCVSCNPSGSRPAGKGVKDSGSPTPAWIAAQIPTWANAFHPPRVLSSDGRRLFFESFDALLPQDTNGAMDVYQWEEASKGDCDVADPNFFAQNGGCLSLISTGKSPRDSEFADASADGSDAFFKTAASILPEDPGLIDLYDARVGGGYPLKEPPVPPCEECQSPPPPPQAPTPASGSFQGEGDPAPEGKRKPKRCPKGKRKARKGAKVTCIKKKQGRKQRRQGRSR